MFSYSEQRGADSLFTRPAGDIIVTGSNKGIGYAIVKGLCQKFEGDVILTARNADRGKAALKSLNELGFQPKFHVLDVDNLESIRTFKTFINETYKGIDVLVNNAAIAFKAAATEPFAQQARETIRTNYFGLLNVCKELLPLLRPHARVVNLSSLCGHLSQIPSKKLRDTFSSSDLTETKLTELINSFVKAAEDGNHTELGWPNSAYVVSKVGVSALTRIQQREFDKDSRKDIIVNSVHPGYVDTDMTSHKGPLTIEEGAVAPLYCALLPENTDKPKGDYVWLDKRIIDWVHGPMP
ncbi:hypothetical protein V9T40_000432 [Parthenolecanium corni]|uniref:carbonyl reductase (NADPH) n=1 Tax=Parthenolecanium corni TaxID=536013 RepID=A0AAN9T9B8_9HEMI